MGSPFSNVHDSAGVRSSSWYFHLRSPYPPSVSPQSVVSKIPATANDSGPTPTAALPVRIGSALSTKPRVNCLDAKSTPTSTDGTSHSGTLDSSAPSTAPSCADAATAPAASTAAPRTPAIIILLFIFVSIPFMVARRGFEGPAPG